MILYLDTSALVKRYVMEAGSAEVLACIGQADAVGSVVLTRVEMAAAFARAARLKCLGKDEADIVWQDFLADWPAFARLPVSQAAQDLASRLAWEHGLRGDDAMHFSAALSWQAALETPVTLATFDRELWSAAGSAGMEVWPKGL